MNRYKVGTELVHKHRPDIVAMIISKRKTNKKTIFANDGYIYKVAGYHDGICDLYEMNAYQIGKYYTVKEG